MAFFGVVTVDGRRQPGIQGRNVGFESDDAELRRAELTDEAGAGFDDGFGVIGHDTKNSATPPSHRTNLSATPFSPLLELTRRWMSKLIHQS